MNWPDVLQRLPDALRDAGVPVVETAGWQARGFDLMSPVGQMNHHTAIRGPATPSTADLMIRGRSDLAGPLCNAHGGLGADNQPVLYLIAGRSAHHAGAGSGTVLQEVGRDIAPTGDARTRRLADTPGANGNTRLFGWEWQHPGDASPWLPPLLELVGTCNTVLARLAGWSANRSIHHREWTARKIDMSWRGDLRALVSTYLEDDDMFTNDDRTLLRRAVNMGELAALGDDHPAAGDQKPGYYSITEVYKLLTEIRVDIAELKARSDSPA